MNTDLSHQIANVNGNGLGLMDPEKLQDNSISSPENEQEMAVEETRKITGVRVRTPFNPGNTPMCKFPGH